MPKVLLYELNEVPWRVIDTFVKRHPTSTLAEILKESLCYETYTQDSGELHPWSTWPTVHRGVYNDVHDIRFLNQKILTPYKPSWELLEAHGVTVGVFGSLHSWPVPQKGYYAFYVPDTFAQDSHTLPSSLESFQRFNLTQTQRDSGVVARHIRFNWTQLKDLIGIIRRGLKFKTLLQAIRQLIREVLNKNFKSVRSIYQSPIAFDLFFRLLTTQKPSYATFFTNHVAGMMHRYWKYLYPEDFNYKLKSNDDFFKAQAILRAMEIADEQLKKLKTFADAQGYGIAIVSSMGQEAIDRGEYLGQLHIRNMQTFYQAIQFEGAVKNNMAMSPDFTFEFQTLEDLERFQNCVLNLTDTNGTPVFGFKRSDLTLNINLQTTAPLVKSGGLYRHQKSQKLSFIELGITVEQRDPGTGYHQPKGIAIFYKKGVMPNQERTTIESVAIAPTLLALFEAPIPGYMKAPIQKIVDSFKNARKL